MKILHLIQKPQLRGAEIFACQLSNYLVQAGHQVKVISLLPGDGQLPFKGKIVRLNRPLSKRFFDFTGWRKLAEEIKSFEPDIVQANAGDTLKFAVFSKIFFQWKSKIVFRNASTISLYTKTPWSKWLNSFFYSRTDYIISVSEQTKNDLVRLFPQVSQKISVVPIGIDPRDVSAIHVESSDGPVFLHIGGFTFEKNHAGLIHIFEKILQRYPNAVLWLVGDGPLRSSVEKLVSEKNLEDKVILHGYQQEPLRFLKSCDAFLLPSIIEGLPSVILEAFYCNKPVIVYDVGGISEVLRPNATGWLIKKNDEESFVKAVVECISNPDHTKTCTSNAYRLVEENFLMEKIAGRFVTVYENLIGNEPV